MSMTWDGAPPPAAAPPGQRGWYCYWRVGADSVNDDAFRLMSIPTTA